MNDVTEASAFILGQQKNTRSSVVDSLDADPEKAARAVQLEQATSVPSPLIHDDLENFEKNHKAALTSDLLRNNHYLSTYINSHPMAAKISNDDLGPLDEALDSTKKFVNSTSRPWYQIMAASTGQAIHHSSGHTLKFMGELLGLKSITNLGSQIEAGTENQFPMTDVEKEALSAKVGNILGALTVGGGAAIVGGLPGLAIQMGAAGGGQTGEEARAAGASEETVATASTASFALNALLGIAPFHLLMKPVQAAAPGLAPLIGAKVGQAAKSAGIFAGVGEVQNVLNAALARELYNPSAQYHLDAMQIAANAIFGGALGAAASRVKPFIDAGRDIPPGIHPAIDEIKSNLAKVDAQNLDDAFQKSQASASRERSPEIFAEALRQNTSNKLGFSADAVRKLYGDKEPTLEDGKLGWVPNIVEQLRSAAEVGGDVEIPLADVLAKLDPKVYKELKDDIRHRPNGLTLNEAKGLKESTALEPKLSGTQDGGEAQSKEGITAFTASAASFDKFDTKFIGSGMGHNYSGYGFYLSERQRHSEQLKSTYFPKGNVREVNIKARPEELLDLDKPATEQQLSLLKEVGAITDSPRPTGRDVLSALEDVNVGKYREILNDPRISTQQEGAAKLLNQSGIKGNTFTDVYGRHYVVHDPSLLDIKADPAIEAIRSQAGLEPLLDVEQATRSGKWRDVSSSVQVFIPKRFTKSEQEIYQVVSAELDRLVPKGVQSAPGIEIEARGRKAHGIFQQYTNRLPLILYSLTSDDPIGTARHEAIHHLRQEGFFTRDEWSSLQSAAIKEKWIYKERNGPGSSVYDRYKRLHDDVPALLEEAIADEFGHWKRDPKADHIAGKVFEKLRELLEKIKEKLEALRSKNPVVDSIFSKVESGEVGNRESTGPLKPQAFREGIEPLASEKQGELDVTRQEDKQIFKPAALGTNAKMYKKYMELIAERNAKDEKFQLDRATSDAQRRQTKEWKENEKVVRVEVKSDAENRPDIVAAEMFRNGMLYGDKLTSRPKLDPKRLTDEQKAGLPKDMMGPGGVHPDDVASLFNFESGDAMVAKLIELEKNRGDTPLKDFLARVVDEEVERRMQKKYGNLADNIIEEVKDHVLSDTQMDLLHEETVQLGMEAGAEMTFTKKDVEKWVKDRVGQLAISELDSDKFLNAAGRASRGVEEALLKGDPTEAFRLKQQQRYAALYAKEAAKLEKEVVRFEKEAKRLSSREVASVPGEYMDFIHNILSKIGQPIRRSVQDLQDSIQGRDQKTLEDFVDYKRIYGWRKIPVAEFLFDPNFRKPLEQLTAGEFRAVRDSVSAMVKNGRDELTIEKGGEQADFEKVRDEGIEKMEFLGVKKHPIDRPQGEIISFLKTARASVLTFESVMNRIDRDDPGGVFNQYLVRPLTAAANFKSRLIREYDKHMREAVGKIDNIDKEVANDLFIDPLTGIAFKMRHRNVLGILQNVGNVSNLTKVAKGYGLEPQQVLDWLYQRTTKEDWDRAQRIGKVFDRVFTEIDKMEYQMNGVHPEKIEITPIDTPFGKYEGWYNPIKFDSVRPGESKKLMGPNALENDTFFRASTPQKYLEKRTGYIAPVELNLDVVPMRLNQMLHDLAYRPAIIQVAKFMYDPKFQRGMMKHLGENTAKQMLPYLKDVANHANFDSDAAAQANTTIEAFRQNMIHTLIGMNPHTVGKHGMTAAFNSLTEVGPINFMREFGQLLGPSEEVGKSNWRYAMDKSEELQRRTRNWKEMAQERPEVSLMKSSPREMMQAIGSTPVAVADLLSTVPTWLAQYKKSIAAGLDEGQSVFEADRVVRRTHGSSVITNRPAIMRTNALGRTFTALYGFFSHMLQKQYELAWKAKDAVGGFREGNLEDAKKYAPQLIMGFVSYVILPALVEEMVTPYISSERDSWGVKVAKSLALGMSSSLIGVRDFIHALINMRDPAAGLASTFMKTGTDIARDLRKGVKVLDKEHAGNLIKHTFALVGATTGLTNAQTGRSTAFMYRYYQGLEHPKYMFFDKHWTPGGEGTWAKGLTRGTLKESRH